MIGTCHPGAGFAVRAAVAGLMMALVPGTIRTRAAANQSPPAGADFPNVSVQTQDGTRVRFYEDLIKGKVVLRAATPAMAQPKAIVRSVMRLVN